ncbi:MAG: glycosyltransferase family 9 protein [Chloroflexia bacterium]
MLAKSWQGVKRILAVRLDNVGDMVMLGPSLRTLRDALPGAHITLMASPAGSQVAPLLPWVDEVMVHRAVWQDASGQMPHDPGRERETVETIRARDFDAALIFTSFSQSPWPPAYACYLAGVPIRLGQSKEFGGSLLTHWVKSLPDSAHQADRNLYLLESAGFPISARHLELRVPPGVQASADDVLLSVGIDPTRPFIALAPGASCAARRYDPERYAEVARSLAAQTGLPIVVLGSERERDLVEYVTTHGRASELRIVPLAGRTSVPELAALIRRACLLIANDSGPMHIADAFGTPMVILFSGTELESQWRPRTALTRLLRRSTPCAPCYNFLCPYDMECLDIAAEEVVAEAVALLSETMDDGRWTIGVRIPVQQSSSSIMHRPSSAGGVRPC